MSTRKSRRAAKREAETRLAVSRIEFERTKAEAGRMLVDDLREILTERAREGLSGDVRIDIQVTVK